MGGNITAGVAHAFRTLLLNICEEIYSLIIFCFDIFEQFGNLRILENQVGFIFQKVSFILGLFMIFRLSFAAIEYVVNPDNMLDKTKGIGNIVKKVLIVIVLLGSTHFLFDFAYEAQEALIKNEIIGKILLSTPDNDYQSDGSEIAWNIFNAFYTLNPDVDEVVAGSDAHKCVTYFDDGTYKTDLTEYHNMAHAFGCVNITDGEDNGWTFIKDESLQGNYIVSFHGIIAIAAGIVMLWIIISYTVQLGIRAIQLAYLELIAPIPIMMYLMPKGEDKLGKWGQQCLITFLDFFIRLAIIDFIILVSSELIYSFSNEKGEFFGTFANLTNSWGGTAYVLVIMIVALFMFAKRIPKLLGEIFPTMGGAASLGFGVNFKQLGSFAGGFAGATVGGATNAVVGALDRGRAAKILGKSNIFAAGAAATGFFGGIATGIKSGAKGGNVFKNIGSGWTARNKADLEYEKLIASGGNATGRFIAGVRSNFGPTPGQDYTRRLGNLNKISSLVDNIISGAESSTEVRSLRDALTNATQRPGESLKEFLDRKNEMNYSLMSARENFANAVKNGKTSYTYELATGTDANGNIITQQKTVKIATQDDINASEVVMTNFNDIAKTIDSNSVQEWDGNDYVPMDKPDDFAAAIVTKQKSNETARHIKKDEKPAYRPTITNETAAGIDLNQFNENKPK